MTTPQTRLPPLPRERWDDAVLEALRPTGTAAGPVPNAFTTFAHNPRVAKAFFSYHAELVRRATLDARAGELLLLRVAWRTRSAYQWAQHSRIAGRFGITADELGSLSTDRLGPTWSAFEGLLLRAVDEVVENFQLTAATWASLAASLDEAQLVELVMLIGFHTSTAIAMNSFAIAFDDDLLDVPLPSGFGHDG